MHERPQLRRERIWLGLAIAVMIVVANAYYVAQYTGLLHGPEVVLETDHLRYIEMARGAENTPWRGLAYEPPFCYRILTPKLVGLLVHMGVDLHVAFYALTHVFLVLFLFALYLFLTTFGLEERYCVLGLLLTGLMQGAVRWYSYQYWMTDPLALLLITVALLLIRLERLGALFVLSIVAVTARETYLLVFPYLFFHTWRRAGLKLAIERTLAIAIAPVVMLLWIRTSAPALAGPDFVRLVKFFAKWRWERMFDNQLYLCTIGSFGVLFPLLLLYPRRMLAYWIRNPEEIAVIGAVYASLLLANNTDRLLAYALPVMLPAALLNLRRLVASVRLPFAAIAAAALLAQVVLYRETIFFDWRAVSVSQPFNGLAAFVIFAFWMAAVAAWWFAPSDGNEAS
ncbi:MAG: hypothetical protein AAEJ52_02190 [Myxococcota bacterium]